MGQRSIQHLFEQTGHPDLSQADRSDSNAQQLKKNSDVKPLSKGETSMIPVTQPPMNARGPLPGPFLFSSAPPEGGQTGKKNPPKKAEEKKAGGAKPVKKQRGGKR